MRNCHSFLFFAALFQFHIGCDDSSIDRPKKSTTPEVMVDAPQTAPDQPKPAAPPAAAPVLYPEDKDVDPVRDPIVRAKAKELNAIAPKDMNKLKAGDEVYLVVRGDKGGGTIYGSG